DDVSGIHDNNVIIHQGRYFNASIKGLKRLMVRPEQSVNSLVTQLFVFQCHPHLACEWTERTVIQFHHDMTSQLRLCLDRADCSDSALIRLASGVYGGA